MNSFAEMLGINTSENKTCFLGTTDEGMAVLVNGKDFFLRYADFPWFEYCGATELRDVTADRWGVYWNTIGIDLPIEALEHPNSSPKRFPWNPGSRPEAAVPPESSVRSNQHGKPPQAAATV